MLALTIFGERTVYGYGTTLYQNELLLSAQNQSIISPNGVFQLKMQDDGNLVVYHLANAGNGVSTKALWWTGTSNQPGQTVHRVVMQNDANLVIYSTLNVPIW